MNVLHYRPAVVPLRRAGSPRRPVVPRVELGRALVAPGQSVVVPVLSKRNQALYIHDGVSSGGASRTAFNGFDQASLVEDRDRPLLAA